MATVRAQEQHLNDLKSTVLDLINDLKENVFTRQDEQGDLMMTEFFFKRMHAEAIMNYVIKFVLPFKDKVVRRDVSYFIDNPTIFGGLPEDRVSYYADVISGRGATTISEGDRNVIWEYFDTLIAIAENYKKMK